MHIDIASHIEKLLFLHDTLIIPSFGGFTAMRAPAGVDYVGGAVTPPSKTLTFNENLTTDDGILVDDIASANHITAEEARRAIEQFVDQTELQLNQREIVTLPGVGRLYKNYVQRTQFLPDATNFHAGSYRLPPLQFSPITRSREVIEKPAAAPASNENIRALPALPACKNDCCARYSAAATAAGFYQRSLPCPALFFRTNRYRYRCRAAVVHYCFRCLVVAT